MEIICELGTHIKRARKEKNYTQEKLAEMLNISPTHLKHIESGHRKPSVDVLFLLSQYLDMSLDEIVFNRSESKQTVMQNKITLMLNDCTDGELKILYDIISSMQNNRTPLDSL